MIWNEKESKMKNIISQKIIILFDGVITRKDRENRLLVVDKQKHEQKHDSVYIYKW